MLRSALIAGFVLAALLGAALAGPAPGLLAGRKNVKLVGRGICSKTLLQDPPCGGGDIALKLSSNSSLPCSIWQLAAVTPTGPSQHLVGVPVTFKSECRMPPNPTCNAALTGPSTCTDGYAMMAAGGQWVIEAVGSATPQRYRLHSLARGSCPAQYLGAAKVADQSECDNPPRLGFRAPAGAGATYLDQWTIEDVPTPPSPPPPKHSPPPPKHSPPPPSPPRPSPPSPRPPPPSPSAPPPPSPSPPPPPRPSPPPPPPLQQPLWVPAGLNSEAVTSGAVTSLSSGYDQVTNGPYFAAVDDADGKGAVYYSPDESVCAQQGGGGGRRLLRGATACHRRRHLSGAGGWQKYMGQDFGSVGGFVSMQVATNGQPAVAYRDTTGAGIFKVFNGTDWDFGCTADGKFADDANYISLAFPWDTMVPMYGQAQYVAYADGANVNMLTVKYCEAGQWQTFGGTPYPLPVTDIHLVVWPWTWSNGTYAYIPAVVFIDTNSNMPTARYYNRTSGDWQDTTSIPATGPVSNLQARFAGGVIPVIAFTDDGNGGQGSMLYADTSSRRRSLLSASGVASAASAQSVLNNNYQVKWSSLPPTSANFTPGAASNFDMTVLSGAPAAIVAYCDETAGGKITAKLYNFMTGSFIDLGQQGFTPGAASLTALYAGLGVGMSSPYIYCGFRDESAKPALLSIYKINLKDWIHGMCKRMQSAERAVHLIKTEHRASCCCQRRAPQAANVNRLLLARL
ncbi:hypothetical protein ABPG75_010592 [Micractinium tetrahymenae]